MEIIESFNKWLLVIIIQPLTANHSYHPSLPFDKYTRQRHSPHRHPRNK